MENQPEPEHKGSIWSHPYMVYIYLTILLALFVTLFAWMALEFGWLPERR